MHLLNLGAPADLAALGMDFWSTVHGVTTYPERQRPRMVGALPPGVEKAFRDGEEEVAAKRFRSAVGSYRTALERALRAMDPDLESRLSEGGTKRVSLNNKIQAIRKEKLLPPALIDLASHVRSFGNDIHEDEDPDEAQAKLAGDCAHLLLLYLFELPAKVQAAGKRIAEDH